uniref:Putative secreted protein n=1 Tax=Anopheles darlingi TaxID=43151 RepID=A0A2M4D9M5_ANODA
MPHLVSSGSHTRFRSVLVIILAPFSTPNHSRALYNVCTKHCTHPRVYNNTWRNAGTCQTALFLRSADSTFVFGVESERGFHQLVQTHADRRGFTTIYAR